MSVLTLTLGSLFIWKHPRFSRWLLGFPLPGKWEGVKYRWMNGCLPSSKQFFLNNGVKMRKVIGNKNVLFIDSENLLLSFII